MSRKERGKGAVRLFLCSTFGHLFWALISKQTLCERFFAIRDGQLFNSFLLRILSTTPSLSLPLYPCLCLCLRLSFMCFFLVAAAAAVLCCPIVFAEKNATPKLPRTVDLFG